MGSILKLYKSCKIVKDENFILNEDISSRDLDTYLNRFAGDNILRFENVQLVENKLDIEIKVQLQQDLGDMSWINLYNYARYKRSEIADIRPMYYFIDSIELTAPLTIKLKLHLDVLNSFPFGDNGNNEGYWNFSKLTQINRQHKDRFVKSGNNYIAHIDEYSEGIIPPLYKLNNALISQKLGNLSYESEKYYLMYKNTYEDSSNVNNAVKGYLIFEAGKRCQWNGAGLNFNPANMDRSKFYYLFYDSCTGFSAADIVTGQSFTFLRNYAMIKLKCLDNYIVAYSYGYDNGLYAPPYENGNPAITEVHIITSFSLAQNDKYYMSSGDYQVRRTAYQNSIQYTASDISTIYTENSKRFVDINRTDSRIIKIIEIPYLPDSQFALINDNSRMTFNSEKFSFNMDERLLEIKDNAVLSNLGYISDTSKIPESLTNIYPLINVSFNGEKSLHDYRNDDNEPKIYHSDFYQTKYVYDSFAKIVKNEVDMNRYEANIDSYINFYMTSTINSRFMFEFPFIKASGYFVDEDYPKHLIVQRNNEVTLYNSPYINYIRTGFNYDVKNKNRQEAFSWFTTGMGLAGGIVSLAAGSKTLGAGLIASSVLSIASSLNNTIQSESNLEQKINQLKWQGNSVYGADDVDLMLSYNFEGKLWRAKYTVSNKVKKSLLNLFHYTGYIDNVSEIPNTRTRMWFNFLQCDLHFAYVNNISKECIEELKAKYKGGVTFLHSNTLTNFPVWDFARERENWERIFFEN